MCATSAIVPVLRCAGIASARRVTGGNARAVPATVADNAWRRKSRRFGMAAILGGQDGGAVAPDRHCRYTIATSDLGCSPMSATRTALPQIERGPHHEAALVGDQLKRHEPQTLDQPAGIGVERGVLRDRA